MLSFPDNFGYKKKVSAQCKYKKNCLQIRTNSLAGIAKFQPEFWGICKTVIRIKTTSRVCTAPW